MDAHCTGCSGRVMPYRQYAIHFRPTAVCASCGSRVRLRHFGRVVFGFVAVLAGFVALLVLSRSRVLVVAGLALLALGSLLADFWTFRNLPWDPVQPVAGGHPPGESATASRVTRSQ